MLKRLGNKILYSLLHTEYIKVDILTNSTICIKLKHVILIMRGLLKTLSEVGFEPTPPFGDQKTLQIII